MQDLAFDRYQRFRAASELIDEIAANASILEIGSFDNALAPFLAAHQHQHWPQIIRPGQPINLPDNSYDICLALDVLEHVPANEREFFISELARVGKRAVVLAFPVSSSMAAEKFVWQLTGSAWLAEHIELGLPDKQATEELFSKLGLSYSCHPNAALPSWTAMMLLMHGVEPDLRATISAFFNRHYYMLENREPAYRYIYVLNK